jgi:hypothetical protein
MVAEGDELLPVPETFELPIAALDGDFAGFAGRCSI